MTTKQLEISPTGQKRVLAIALVQPDASLHSPTVTIRSLFGDVPVLVGSQTFPSPSGAPGSGTRLAALVDVPGTQSYSIDTDGDATVIGQWDQTEVYLMQPLVWAGGAAPVSSSQPNSYLWVAPNGNNATAQRGRLDLPFQTVQAAVNAAQNGDCIIVAPGVYNENVSIPAALSLLTIRAETDDGASTQIQGNNNAIEFSPGGSQVLNLLGLGLFGTNAGVRAVGTNPGANQATLTIRGGSLNGGAAGLIAQNLGNVNITSGIHGQVSILDCDNAFLSEGAQIALLELGVSPVPPPSLNHSAYQIGGGLVVGQLEQQGACRVISDKSTRCVSLNASLASAGITPGTLVYPAFADNAQVFTENGCDVQLNGATMDIFSWQHNGIDPLTADARGATLRQIFVNTTGGDATLDVYGGAVSWNISLFGANCYAVREGGGAVSLSVPAGGGSFAFGVDLLGPPYPAALQIAYTVSPRASTTAVDQIVYVDGASGPAGAALGNDSAAPVVVDLTWELVAA